ncbi:hypothetical protein LS77_009870 [Helicobacter bilis]|uniref:Uncharacterized protein n=2 Tax=Helicobacter bilis TaxID=37372 RepID=A0A6D2C4C7_9HELI|nr:hypothetical protein [Helicobacter bilis]EMZ36260.1 hypothetical protein C826_02414 [Helicobacter bilis WiWa]TLE02639.1 hypothetical protein LS77_009870 [Helicobacter bilis]TLE03730.1 hypothetical protein LS76_009940 [Helicobacter bilis]
MIISNTRELLQEIDNILSLRTNKTIKNITLICQNMNANFTTHNEQSPQNLGQEILARLQHSYKEGTTITIHSFDTLNEEQILGTKQHLDLPNYIHLEIHHNDNTILQAILDSIKKSTSITANNLEEILDKIDSNEIQNISLQKSKCIITKQLRNMLKESELFAEIMAIENEKNIEYFIDRLEQYIKQAIKDNDKERYKNIIKTIFGIVLAVVMRGGAAMVLLGISATLLSSLMDYKDSKKNKYSYIKNPIIESLATELAMYIQLANTQLLTCMLIVESTQENRDKIEFIDLSGFNLYLDTTLLSCCQSIAFKGEFNKPLDISNLLQKNAINLPTIQHNNIMAKILHTYKPTPKESNDTNSKQQDIKNTPLLTSIQQETQRFNHLVYIESPHFNSALLAEIFRQKNLQYPNNHTTNMAKNYLFITNAPSKYNAKLTETITQHIANNAIKDDMNNRTQQNLNISHQGKTSNYNATRDYSAYRIDTDKKDDEPYILQLSLFARADIADIEKNCKKSDTYKQAEKSRQARQKDYDDSTKSGYLGVGSMTLYGSMNQQEAQLNNIKQTYGIDYIESFFKNPKEIEDIIKKEEQNAKDFLTQLQLFHNNNKNLNNSLLAMFSLFYGLYVFKTHFPSFALQIKKDTQLINNPYLKISCLNKTWEFNIASSDSEHNAQIAQELQEKLLQTNSIQKTDLSQDFLNYLRDLIKSDIDNNAKALDDEIIKEIGIDLDKELQQEEEKIKDYGEKYVNIVKKERTQEVFYTSMLKILGAICPFINFTHENMIDTTKHCLAIFITALENLGKTQGLQVALYNTLLTEIGVFSYFLIPTSISVQIGANKNIKDGKINLAKKIEDRLSKIVEPNKKEYMQNIFKGFAQIELKRTQIQLAHFEAKTAFILDTINNDIKQLNLQAIKQKLMSTMTSSSDRVLIAKVCFTYKRDNNKPQSYLLSELQTKERFSQTKQFYRNKIFHSFKINLSATLVDIALNAILDFYFHTNYETYRREYESIMHTRYTFYYDLPYAVKRKDSLLEFYDNTTIKREKELTYYPMIIASKFISCDLQSVFYGTELCTGGLTHHIGLVHHLTHKQNNNNLQEFLLKKLLSYLIIDEKRGAKDKDDYELHYNKQVSDYTFFNHKALDSKGNITDTRYTISLDNILKYQVPKNSSLYKEFKVLEDKKDKRSAIDSYNEALEILADYKDYYFTNTRSGKPDKNKARRLLECLDIIGRNNIKALYVGTSDASKNMKRPKFIGRLATTIIIEDGLWLG